MALQLHFRLDGVESKFDFKKIDRDKLYGRRRRVVLDDAGKDCVKAELSEDGTTIITSGMALQAYFDEEGEWVEHSRLVGLDESGEPVDKVPSTLGVAQELEESSPEELSQNQMVAVYQLFDAEVDAGLRSKLDAGSIFKFSFNYRADYAADPGFLIGNEEGVFALITKEVAPVWCQLKTVAVDSFDDQSEVDDDLDFEMF